MLAWYRWFACGGMWREVVVVMLLYSAEYINFKSGAWRNTCLYIAHIENLHQEPGRLDKLEALKPRPGAMALRANLVPCCQ